MKDDIKDDQECGCDCEMCRQGRHEECTSGKCIKKAGGDSEEEM